MKYLGLLAMVLLLCGFRSEKDTVATVVIQRFYSPSLGVGCLSVFGHDPNPGLLAKLHTEKLSVVPRSACKRGQFGAITFHGKFAVSISVGKFRKTGATTATVEFIETTGAVGGSGLLVKLLQVNGKWLISSHRMLWIS